jgi:DUF971 family protein
MTTETRRLATELKLRTTSRILEVAFDNGEQYALTFEYLRVFSPSAEVRGHGADDGILQIGKEDVQIDGIEPVGQYAIKLKFSDGHDTGLYSWNYLYDLGVNQQNNWADYQRKLADAHHMIEPRHTTTSSCSSKGCK